MRLFISTRWSVDSREQVISKETRNVSDMSLPRERHKSTALRAAGLGIMPFAEYSNDVFHIV
jgi:hypothetical protein